MVEGIFNKNMISGWFLGGIDTTDGSDDTTATSRKTDYIEVDFTKFDNYYLSGLPSEKCSKFIAGYNSNKQFLGRTGVIGSSSTQTYRSITSSSFTGGTAQGTGDVKYIRVCLYGPTGTYEIDDIINIYSSIQLEIGASATTYVKNWQYGYIIGSNSNGTFLKYADGTLICFGTNTYTGARTTSLTSGGYRTAGTDTTYAYPFIAKPTVVAQDTSAVNNSNGLKYADSNISSIKFSSAWWGINSNSSNATYSLRYIAIGRWK